MKSVHPAHSKERGLLFTFLLAMIGLGVTLWVNALLGIQKGDAATVSFLLVGVPTYYGLAMVDKLIRGLRQSEGSRLRWARR